MTDITTFVARRTLIDLEANGAVIRRQLDGGDGLPRAVVECRPGADRTRCRTIVAEAKANGAWPAMIRSLPVTEECS